MDDNKLTSLNIRIPEIIPDDLKILPPFASASMKVLELFVDRVHVMLSYRARERSTVYVGKQQEKQPSDPLVLCVYRILGVEKSTPEEQEFQQHLIIGVQCQSKTLSMVIPVIDQGTVKLHPVETFLPRISFKTEENSPISSRKTPQRLTSSWNSCNSLPLNGEKTMSSPAINIPQLNRTSSAGRLASGTPSPVLSPKGSPKGVTSIYILDREPKPCKLKVDALYKDRITLTATYRGNPQDSFLFFLDPKQENPAHLHLYRVGTNPQGSEKFEKTITIQLAHYKLEDSKDFTIFTYTKDSTLKPAVTVDNTTKRAKSLRSPGNLSVATSPVSSTSSSGQDLRDQPNLGSPGVLNDSRLAALPRAFSSDG